MVKYDYFIGGRWRNHKAIEHVMESVRGAGKTAYCFIENTYDSDGISIDESSDVEASMQGLEALADWRTNPTFRQIFDNDMNGIRESEEFIIVFPAGKSAHMELGAAYGMGKKCYGIGEIEKNETLYLMMDEIYPDVEAFVKDRIDEEQ